jgi:purine-binding chemotaxis protein CheW
MSNPSKAQNIDLLETEETILQVVSFRLHDEVYALDILHVQEIIKVLPVTQVPLSAPWVSGVINLRGQIIPLIHLARRMGLKETGMDRNTRFMIVRGQTQNVGIIVDEVLEVLRLAETAQEPPPSHLSHREYLQSVSKQDRGMVIVLDLNKVLHLPSPHSEALQEAL